MPREYTISLACAEPGCRERSLTIANTRAEEREIRQRYARSPYKCTRHLKPDEVLSAENLSRTTVLVAGKSERWPDMPELFWNGTRGFRHGPGFKAYANDFPPGTRLVVTARIELPEGGEDQ
ncbi:hypothetical protein [Prauserella endophytica]|uniref:Uncharacterized protein n=1 Tax=Prauserella endophytica TaxID=1592324 RepID=A0ABY2S202_9PSEU|nr:hypothetical protein [Prauserella endophytica]TKG67046.1 hypothetical protein FCN18_24380 [Prauserella endophytica]